MYVRILGSRNMPTLGYSFTHSERGIDDFSYCADAYSDLAGN